MGAHDDDIRKALGLDNGDYDPDRAETLRSMIAETFHGRLRWMTVIGWIYMFAFTGVAVVAAVFFFEAEGTRNLILWATVFATSMLFVSILKLWFWMTMNRNSVLRELKRLELRLVELEMGNRGME